MLLHLRPRVYSEHKRVVLIRAAIDLTDSPGLLLHNRKELMTCRPYQNQGWSVACRRGLLKRDGILVATEGPLRALTCTYFWLVGVDTLCHVVKYEITDGEYDAASDNRMLWRSHDTGSGHGDCWAARYPAGFDPSEFDGGEPCLAVGAGTDVLNAEGSQRFAMPTIQTARLTTSWFARQDRVPPLRHAFLAQGAERPGRGR